MHDQMLRDLLRRLDALERTSARVRVGEVTDIAPLDVALGGASTSYEDVKAIGPVGTGDQVAALLWANDLLVLGAIGDGGAVHWVGTGSEPAFQNSWTNFDVAAGPTGRAAGFYRHAGRVYLIGMVKSGASGTAAFTLPVGYRPMLQTDSAEAMPAFATGGIGGVIVRVNGEVRPTDVGATAVTTSCFLSGVSFRHA